MDVFKAMSEPVRRKILVLLKDGRLSAGDISKNFNLTEATISYHLSVLKKNELIYEEKEKNYIYYSINTSVIEEMILFFLRLKGSSDYEENDKGL